MNFLKKTLGRDEPQPQKQPKPPSSFLRKHQTVELWNSNIQDMIQKRAHKKQETSLDRSIDLIVEKKIRQAKALSEMDHQAIIELFVGAYRRHDKVGKTGEGNVKWILCADLLRRLKLRHKGEDTRVGQFIHELQIEMMGNEKDEKRRKIEEFETMVSFKSCKAVKGEEVNKTAKVGQKVRKDRQKEKEQKNTSLNRSQSRPKKLLNKSVKNLSAKNLSSSSLKPHKSALARKKSEGDLQLTRLQHLLKDVSTRVVKGNLEYDYSSILEGSKSNIQCRRNKNKNLTQKEKEREKEEPKAIEKKVKKNEAFVFYRPGR